MIQARLKQLKERKKEYKRRRKHYELKLHQDSGLGSSRRSSSRHQHSFDLFDSSKYQTTRANTPRARNRITGHLNKYL